MRPAEQNCEFSVGRELGSLAPAGRVPTTGGPAARELARRLVLQHGWNSTTHQVLDSGMHHWFSAAGDALVGYVEVAGVRVVAGAPVADEARLGAAAEEFEADSLQAGRQVCYFAAEERMLAVAGHRRYSRHLLGLQPTWRADSWGERFDACASLRAQRNRALNKGVKVRETMGERERDDDIRECHEAWLSSKSLPRLRFVAHSDPGSDGAAASRDDSARAAERDDVLNDRRLFVATDASGVIGYLSAAPVPSRRGWLVEKLVRRPTAPNGTAELLLDTALRSLAVGSERFTLGLSPWATCLDGRGADQAPDEAPVWLELARRLALRRGRTLYDFAGLYAFKSKFRPETWEPVYLLSTERRLTPRTFLALAGAFLGAGDERGRRASGARLGDRSAVAGHPPTAAGATPYRGWWSMPS